MPSRRDAALTARLTVWFADHARPLPWRPPPGAPRDPYHALVSEAMLQQTQVSRVVERFGVFVRRFPTIRDLAAAHEAEVLALWSGLGYYRRAKNLHTAARTIGRDFGGVVPADVASLLRLPGVGRYTAGAIASIAFGRPEPIVDGNVRRVLLRIEGDRGDPAARTTQARVWEQAARLAAAAERPGAFNEAMMELGATVCIPRVPRCPACPVKRLCRAFREGRQDVIPARGGAKKAKREVFCAAVVAVNRRGELLVERRGERGMWAGMWQAPTLERSDRPATEEEIAAWIGARSGRGLEGQGGQRGRVRVEPVDSFLVQATHRAVRFDVWRAKGLGRSVTGAEWKSPRRVENLALSNAQRRILLPAPGQARSPRLF